MTVSMPHCLFCQLRHNKSSICFEDEYLFIINDTSPQALVHQLVIPKRHIPTLNDITKEERELVGHMMYIAKVQARYHQIEQSGFRTVLNCNQEGGQTIYHLHLHLLGGRSLTWPPG